jgi:Winged helix-turn helix
MTEHDVLVGYRLRLFTLAEELGNVSQACRLMGVHRSTCYRWKRQVDRWAWERSTCGGVAGRGCPTRSARTWSSGSSRSPLPIRGSGPDVSPDFRSWWARGRALRGRGPLAGLGFRGFVTFRARVSTLSGASRGLLRRA